MANQQIDRRRTVEYLRERFCKRNGQDINPQLGINYTIDTLSYMQTCETADKITEYVLSTFGPNSTDVRVIEATAGIGGNSFSFLQDPRTNLVVAYELNPDRQQMLLRNLLAYKFAPERYIVAENGDFTGVPQVYQGAALVFDPPWLPPDVSGQYSTTTDYLTSNIKVGAKYLEQWVVDSSHCTVISLYVPINYKINAENAGPAQSILINNFIQHEMPLNRISKLILFYPARNGVQGGISLFASSNFNDLPPAPNKEELKSLQAVNEEVNLSNSMPTDQSAFNNIPTIDVANGSSNNIPTIGLVDNSSNDMASGDLVDSSSNDTIAIPSSSSADTVAVSPSQMREKEASTSSVIPLVSLQQDTASKNASDSAKANDQQVIKVWLLALRQHIRSELGKIYGSADKELILRLTSNDNLATWVKAFTAENVDPNNNYETLEHFGDKMLGVAFDRYLIKNYPTITSGQLTNLQSFYMSKYRQPKYTRAFQLDKWVRSNDERLGEKVLGDLFESFCGALATVGDMVGGLPEVNQPGLGYNLILRLIVYLFQRVDTIDMTYSKVNTRSQVKEIFEKLGGENEREFIYDTDERNRRTGEVEVRIILKDKGKELIKAHNSNFNKSILATGKAFSRDMAKREAFSNAVDTLQSLGITYDKALSSQRERLFHEVLGDLGQLVGEKYRREGYTAVDFKDVRKTNNMVMVNMQGHKPDGTIIVIATGQGETNEEAYINAAKKYIANT